MISCPPLSELELFLLGRLNDFDSEIVESHLSECEACQEQITKVNADDDIVRAMRKRPTALGSQAGASDLRDASDELMGLLIPHLKRISKSVDLLPSSGASDSTRDPSIQTETFVPFVHADSVASDTTTTEFANGGAVGEMFGNYEIRGILGSGGMGTVYHAYDPLLRRSVAIKAVNGNLLSAPGIAERLVREAQAVAAVEHDHIVAIHAVETLNGLPCIIMPLLRGRTLKERLESVPGPLPLNEIIEIGRDATNGLIAAHAQGLVHCDIKPANLWIDEVTGRIKILDFGLAVIHGDAENGNVGVCGTPGFLAPEQARGAAVDPRTDLFSLGCVLYRAATGRAPFTGEPTLRSLWTAIGTPPAPAIDLNPGLPVALSQLLDRLLSRNPEHRPASAKEVLNDLDAIVHRQVRDRNHMIRRRWLIGMAGTALIGATGVGIWAQFNTKPLHRSVDVTIEGDGSPIEVILKHEGQEQSLQLSEITQLKLEPGDYTASTVTVFPQRQLIPDRFVIEAGQRKVIRMALTGEISQHRNHTQAVTGIAVLPRSNPPTVFSVSLDRTLVAWNFVRGTDPRVEILPHQARCVAVSPDGDSVVTTGGNRQFPTELAIRIWDAHRLTVDQVLLDGHERIVTEIAYSPTGNELASAAADGVCLWNAKTGARQTLTLPEEQKIETLAFTIDGKRLLLGSENGQVLEWDVHSNTHLKTHPVGRTSIRAIVPLTHGFVATGDETTIRIWTRNTSQPRMLIGHRQSVRCLAVSQDESVLLSGDQEGLIRVWSLTDYRLIQVLQGHSKEVTAITFLNGGMQAASGSADRTVRVWQLPFP